PRVSSFFLVLLAHHSPCYVHNAVLFFPESLHFPDDLRHLHSFPTRRSSDLEPLHLNGAGELDVGQAGVRLLAALFRSDARRPEQDRKSTRLNSSHQIISYAVFCLKQKISSSLMGLALAMKCPQRTLVLA